MVWAAAATVVSAGEARVSVLASAPVSGVADGSADSAAKNDASLLLRANRGGLRILLAGDLQEAGQGQALAAGEVSADVLVVPHHGSARQDHGFLAAVKAQVAIISVGADNDYGHPAARTVSAVTATGATVLRTDQNGAIAIAEREAQVSAAVQRRP